MRIVGTLAGKLSLTILGALASLLCGSDAAVAQQRVLGLDVSRWQGTISQATWNNIYNLENRQFVFIRSTRGGTTGYDHRQGGFPTNNNTAFALSQRYDDPTFVQNIVRATTAGMFAAPYHFARPDITSNTGTDEANHFIQMAGAWMRPGYLVPVFDLEAGQSQRTANQLAQFSIDFSNRIYEVLGIRPAMYINGNYSNILQGASASLRNQLAQPPSNQPSVVGPAFPVLWNARYGMGSVPQDNVNYDINQIPIQTGSPQNNGSFNSTYYGPWDDYGNSQPWTFWQYASVGRLQSFNNGNSNLDFNVANGDIEFVKNQLVPAVWMNDNSGDWSTLLNWNSGQPANAPAGPPAVPSCGTCTTGTGQVTPAATGPLPTPRLPGAAGSGPTSGQHDTVILERPNADITVTISTGTHNIRKLYMRETLNITGGSLTINYDPTYRPNNSPTVNHGGPISAQFSGPVTLSGGSLTVHTVQVDAQRVFTLAGGTLTFDKINLISNAATKVAVTGDVIINPLNNATATITRSAASGTLDLMGGNRTFTVGNGSADVDFSVAVPIANGGFTKAGLGIMRLDAANTFTGPVTVNGGTLRYGHSSGLNDATLVTINAGAQLDMNGISDTIAGLAGTSGGILQRGTANLTLGGTAGNTTFAGLITGSGALIKNGSATQTLSGNNTLGNVTVNAGGLMLNGANTTSLVTVNGGTLGGSGSVSGNVTLNNGSTLTPGNGVGLFTVGSLNVNAGSQLQFDVSTSFNQDLLLVLNQLQLNAGSVSILDSTGELSPGVYPLIAYGSLVGDVANLGTPVGPAGFEYQLLDSGTVISLAVLPIGVPGDFNNDGTVDSADYVIWKKYNGTEQELPNSGSLSGTVGDGHYNLWRENFGRVAESGGGSSGNGNVPEPTSALLAATAILFGLTLRRRIIR